MDHSDLLNLLYVAVPALVVIAGGGTLIARRRRGEDTTTVDREAPTTPADVAVPYAPAADDVAVETPPAPTVETPAPAAGRLARLRDRLARSGSPLGARMLQVLSRDHLTEDDWDELEETLLLADVGAGPSTELVDALRTQARVQGLKDPAQVRELLREQLLALVDPSLDRSLATTPGQAEDGSRTPAVVMVVGVNGTG